MASAIPSPDEGGCALIITTHNYAHFLRYCLDSVAAQTRPFERVIVVDDASEDNPGAICARYPFVTYLRVEYRDACQARNAGARLAMNLMGEGLRFLLFFDADNWMPANYREALQSAMTDPEVGVTHAPYLYYNGDGTRTDDALQLSTPVDRDRMLLGTQIDTAALMRIEAFRSTRWWRSNPGGLHDWMFYLDLLRRGWKSRLVMGTHVNYRYHKENLSSRERHNLNRALPVYKTSMVLTVVSYLTGEDDLKQYAHWIEETGWDLDLLRLVLIDTAEIPDVTLRLAATLPPRLEWQVCPASLEEAHATALAHTPPETDLVLLVSGHVRFSRWAMDDLIRGLYKHWGAHVACITGAKSGSFFQKTRTVDARLALIRRKHWPILPQIVERGAPVITVGFDPYPFPEAR